MKCATSDTELVFKLLPNSDVAIRIQKIEVIANNDQGVASGTPASVTVEPFKNAATRSSSAIASESSSPDSEQHMRVETSDNRNAPSSSDEESDSSFNDPSHGSPARVYRADYHDLEDQASSSNTEDDSDDNSDYEDSESDDSEWLEADVPLKINQVVS